MSIKTWLNSPIPRKQALAGVLLANSGQVIMYVSKRIALKNAAEVFLDQEQRIAILNEAVEFLLENADLAIAKELDDKLDFWRVIRGKAPRPE